MMSSVAYRQVQVVPSTKVHMCFQAEMHLQLVQFVEKYLPTIHVMCGGFYPSLYGYEGKHTSSKLLHTYKVECRILYQHIRHMKDNAVWRILYSAMQIHMNKCLSGGSHTNAYIYIYVQAGWLASLIPLLHVFQISSMPTYILCMVFKP